MPLVKKLITNKPVLLLELKALYNLFMFHRLATATARQPADNFESLVVADIEPHPYTKRKRNNADFLESRLYNYIAVQ